MRRSRFVRFGMLSVAVLATTWTASAASLAAVRCASAPAVTAPDSGHSTVPLRGCTAPGHGTGINLVGRNFNITNKSGAQSETGVAVDPTNPNHMLASVNDLTTTARVWESTDGGKHWADSGFSSGLPFCYDTWIAFNAGGDAFVAYECSDQRIAYKLAGQTTWHKTNLLGASQGRSKT